MSKTYKERLAEFENDMIEHYKLEPNTGMVNEHEEILALFDGANKKQVDGNHYNKAIQPWDYIIANSIPYMEGNVIKYVTRWRDKGGIKDLEKAKHYIEKLIEVNK